MNLQEKELIEQARLMGIPAHEFAAQFITRDIIETTLKSVRKHAKLKENQEAALIDDLNWEVKTLINAAVVVIAASNTAAIGCVVKSVMVTGKNLRVVADVDASDPQRHALTDTVDQRALLVLAPNDYYAALDSNKPQKDQADLPLEPKEENPLGALQQLADESVKGTGLAATVVEPEPISPYELAFIHVTNGGAITAKAIQEAAGVKRKDVTDIILTLASNGIISEPDEEGLRTLIPAEQRPKTVIEEKHGSGTIVEELATVSDEAFSGLSQASQPFDEGQYADAVLLVQRERKISNAFLRSNFAVNEETADAMIFRMEQDGVISEPNDIGGRAIYD